MTCLPHIVDGGGRFRIGCSGSGASSFCVTGRKPNPTPANSVKPGSFVAAFRNSSEEDTVGSGLGNKGPTGRGAVAATGADSAGTRATCLPWNRNHPATVNPTVAIPQTRQIPMNQRRRCLVEGWDTIEFIGRRPLDRTSENSIDHPQPEFVQTRHCVPLRSGSRIDFHSDSAAMASAARGVTSP